MANEIDDDEAALLDRIADAEMAGRTTIAEALSRRLQSLREAKARGLVVLATERERRR